ncbi:MAG: lysine--tRNA ligase [Patescibacteria group bacterium]
MTEHLGATEKELIAIRKQKLEKMREMGLDPYPSDSSRQNKIGEVIENKDDLLVGGKAVAIAGRIISLRGHGKLVFADLLDESGKIQVVFKADLLTEAEFKLIDLLDRGDFIETMGPLFVTKAGEMTVESRSVKILAKAIRPLPEKWHGLKNEESKLRKRYLDLLLNPELKELFRQKARFWQATRQFLVDQGFWEAETPALETTAGGADANPFVTHHDALDIDVYLRISMGELWQKRLMVAGMEKTFEIGRQFRNEGLSREHLQDYSQMEFYWAYANYRDSMALVCQLYRYIARETFGTTKFHINGFDIDLADEWSEIDYAATVREKMGLDVATATEGEIAAKLKEKKIEFNPADRRGRLIDALWKQIRKGVAGPAFLTNHPVEVSPLAKRKVDNPRLVERYQVILAGSELGNGYSELNDPLDQAERFREQAALRAAGDKDAQMFDQDFVEALEYGMPPTTGFGFSERLFAFLANRPVREAVLFPLMRPQ